MSECGPGLYLNCPAAGLAHPARNRPCNLRRLTGLLAPLAPDGDPAVPEAFAAKWWCRLPVAGMHRPPCIIMHGNRRPNAESRELLRFHGNGAARSVDAPAPEMSPAVAGQSVTDLNRKVGANSPAQMIASTSLGRPSHETAEETTANAPSVFTDATLGCPPRSVRHRSDSRHPRRRRHARYRWIRRRHQLASARDDEHGAVIRHRLHGA